MEGSSHVSISGALLSEALNAHQSAMASVPAPSSYRQELSTTTSDTWQFDFQYPSEWPQRSPRTFLATRLGLSRSMRFSRERR